MKNSQVNHLEGFIVSFCMTSLWDVNLRGSVNFNEQQEEESIACNCTSG
jgi:hypothetical protein